MMVGRQMLQEELLYTVTDCVREGSKHFFLCLKKNALKSSVLEFPREIELIMYNCVCIYMYIFFHTVCLNI